MILRLMDRHHDRRSGAEATNDRNHSDTNPLKVRVPRIVLLRLVRTIYPPFGTLAQVPTTLLDRTARLLVISLSWWTLLSIESHRWQQGWTTGVGPILCNRLKRSWPRFRRRSLPSPLSSDNCRRVKEISSLNLLGLGIRCVTAVADRVIFVATARGSNRRCEVDL